MDSRLDLDKVIRPTLARMEDSLILDLFERANYKVNNVIYQPGGIKILAEAASNVSDYFPIATPADLSPSFLDFLLRGTEELHAKAGRYIHPAEHPFFKGLSESVVLRKSEKSPIKIVDLNLNSRIKEEYLRAIQSFCESGDDGHYGSSAVCDIKCLQDLSRRIHYGKYVAESKYQENPEAYQPLIDNGDKAGLIDNLTDLAVEEKIFARLKEKGARYNVNPEFIINFYRDKIIPLTKEVEIDYFLNKQNGK